jgi:hypothetical protein
MECEFEPAVFMQAQVNFWIAYSEAHQQGTQCIPADSSSLKYCTCVHNLPTSEKQTRFACADSTGKPILTTV